MACTTPAPTITALEHFLLPPRWLFVKVTDSTGLSGWGEATLEGHTRAVQGALDSIAHRLTSSPHDPNAIEHIWQSVHRLGFYRGGPVLMSALAGVDIALWDLKARRLGVPIHDLLGGRLRDRVEVYCWIGGDKPSDVGAAAKARRAQGLRAVKMNATEGVGWLDSPAHVDQVVERVRSVKAEGLQVGLDFHGRLHKPMAKQLARALEAERPLFIEEPLLSEHVEGLKQLAGLTSTPVALGERLYSRWDFKPFLEQGLVDIAQPDLAHAGGISEVRRIAAMAEAYDVPIAPHCPLGPIAFAACLQIDATTPNFAIQEMGLGIHYNTEAGDVDLGTYLAAESRGVLEIQDGFVQVPRGPGLGITVDEEVVRRLSATAKHWDSGGFVAPDGSIREW